MRRLLITVLLSAGLIAPASAQASIDITTARAAAESFARGVYLRVPSAISYSVDDCREVDADQVDCDVTYGMLRGVTCESTLHVRPLGESLAIVTGFTPVRCHT